MPTDGHAVELGRSAAVVRSSVRDRWLVQAAALWCAVAVGTLLFSALVAPTLFDALPHDRLTAGRIAGRGFVVAYAVTFTAALVSCLVLAIARPTRRGNGRLAVALAVAAGLQLFWIAPAILRRGAGWPWSFATLHGAAGVVHLLLAVGALVLAWRMLSDG